MHRDMITKNSVIADVIKQYPKSLKVFRFYHVDRLGCGWGGFSKLTIEQAAQMRRIDIDKLLIRLNKSIKG